MNAVLLLATGATAVTLPFYTPGCSTIEIGPTQQDRQKRLADFRAEIDKWYERSLAACLAEPAGPDRSACLADLRATYRKILDDYKELLRLADTEDTERLKELWKRIREVVPDLPELVFPKPLKNLTPVLPAPASIELNVPLEPSGTSSEQVVWVNGMPVSPVAAGSMVLRAKYSDATADNAPISVTVAAMSMGTTTYTFGPGSTGAITMNSVTLGFIPNGEVTVTASSVLPNGTSVSVVTGLSMSIADSTTAIKLSLDKSCPDNYLAVGASGTGFLKCRATMSYPSDAYWCAPAFIWLEVPVITGSAGQLVISTGGVAVPVNSVFPVSWHPASDFDQDGALTSADYGEFYAALLAGDPRTDLNGDGMFDGDDLVEFQSQFALDQAL